MVIINIFINLVSVYLHAYIRVIAHCVKSYCSVFPAVRLQLIIITIGVDLSKILGGCKVRTIGDD